MNLPIEFEKKMKAFLGDEWDDFLYSYDNNRFQALRFNTLKVQSPEERMRILKTLKISSDKKVSWADEAYYFDENVRPGKHPYHEMGLYYIQEPSAMSAAALLAPKPGMRVLDLCAAPGGKSTQIASAMEGEGLLVTNEIHPARAKILSENVERMGIRNACVLNETPEHLADIFEEYFDRILVDAPCSGEGMFRKNEVACEEWSPENVQLCADRQDGILECAGCWYPAADWCILPAPLHLRRMKAASAGFLQCMRNSRSFP